MCQDCGEPLCQRCMATRTTEHFMCGECHVIIGPVDNREPPTMCPECKSEKIVTSRRMEDACPKCHSSRVVSIEEKRRDLSLRLRQAIMSIQYGYNRLREVGNKLIAVQRTLVSLRRASFVAFYWFEDKVERLQKEMNAIKARVLNQADATARRMAAETRGLMDVDNWTVDQFSFIEGIVTRLMDVGEGYRELVDESLNEISKELARLAEDLEGLEYYRREFASFYEYAELQLNELPVCALPNIKIISSDFLRIDKAIGKLYITNKRLIFMAETGTFRRRTEIIFDYPLQYLTSIEVEHVIRRRVVFKMRQGIIKMACGEQTQRVLREYIEIAKNFDKFAQKDMQRVRRIEQNEFNVSDIRLKIEEMIYTLLAPNRKRTQVVCSPTESANAAPRVVIRQPEPVTGWPYQDYMREHTYRTPHVGPQTEGWGQQDNLPPHEIDSPEIQRLRREVADIERTAQNTIERLKRGHMLIEDFVQTYRNLMRDAYENRRMLEYLERGGLKRRY